MNLHTKKIASSLALVVLGGFLLYGFLTVRVWHKKAVYLDQAIVAAQNAGKK